MQRALTPRVSGVGAMIGQTSVENAGSEAFRGLLHGSSRDRGRAWSLPDINQQDSRAALSGDRGATGVMTCRA